MHSKSHHPINSALRNDHMTFLGGVSNVHREIDIFPYFSIHMRIHKPMKHFFLGKLKRNFSIKNVLHPPHISQIDALRCTHVKWYDHTKYTTQTRLLPWRLTEDIMAVIVSVVFMLLHGLLGECSAVWHRCVLRLIRFTWCPGIEQRFDEWYSSILTIQLSNQHNVSEITPILNASNCQWYITHEEHPGQFGMGAVK